MDNWRSVINEWDSIPFYQIQQEQTHEPFDPDIYKILLNLFTIFIVSLFFVTIFVILAAFFVTRFLRQKNATRTIGNSRPRFRKRDKVLFYGRKMLRKVKSIGSVAGAGKRKKIISRFTKRLLQMKKESSPTQLHVLEPSAEYLQEDIGGSIDQRLPPEVSYMLKSIRMFGAFEKSLFLELCKQVETLRIPAGDYLFKIGDMDENFYVVQSGKLNVFITECDGSTISLKVVKEGDNIASLLSFTDVLTGHTQPLKTVSAQALVDSIVLKLPVAAFRDIFEENPDTFFRVIQIIMVRLTRVIFTALHQHLGLSSELVMPSSRNSFDSQSSMRSQQSNEQTRKTPDLLDSDLPSFSPQMSPNHDIFSTSTNKNIRKRHSAPIQIGSSFDPQRFGRNDDSYESSHNNEKMDDLSRFEDEPVSIHESIELAIEAFKTSLSLEDDKLLREIVHIRDTPSGAYLTKEESATSQQDVGLIYVLSGLLSLSQQDKVLYNVNPGDYVGALAVLTGEPSVFTVRAKKNTRMAFITRNDFYNRLMQENPKVVLMVAHMVIKRLSPFVRKIDFAIDWIFLDSGKALYRQDENSDCTYIVLSGRLRSVLTRIDGKKQLINEYGRGNLCGIVETLLSKKRSTTVMAVRDAELAKLPEGLITCIKLKYPQVYSHILTRILGSWQHNNYNSTTPIDSNSSASAVDFSTVAVLAVSDDVPISAFTFELIHSLSTIGNALRLTSDYVKKLLGPEIFEKNNEYKLNMWLAQQEDKHRIVLYLCDKNLTQWTQRCIRQADCILIVGLGEKEPSVGHVEKQLEHLAIRTQKELVLLHKEGGEKPKNTAAWLNVRSWCSSHHHLLCPKRMFSKRARNIDYFEKLIEAEPNIHSDFSRLARWLTGNSVGLVLGGGGARGAAHIGMIKAIQEAGIPIDMVGGVSIGSFMGALWASERNITTMTQKAREWSKKMTQWWRQILDLTYPVTSMFTGAGFNKTLFETFADIQIEDLYLPYFAVTTDLTSSSIRVHTYGSLWRYIRGSMTLSGYLPPLCDRDGHYLLDGGYLSNLPDRVWKVCRASMSIAGVFPPWISDDGHYLLDGAYVDNVPADIMRARGARYILAIDVGATEDTDLTNYGDSLSGFWLIWQRYTSYFRTEVVKVPNLPDIQSRLAYVSCVRQLEAVRNMPGCHYIRPPIDRFKTLQFGSFDEIKEVGYNHGKTYFDGMMKAGQGNLGNIITLITSGSLGNPSIFKTLRTSDTEDYSYSY